MIKCKYINSFLTTETQLSFNSGYIYMMLIHESHVFELQVEKKFEVWDPAKITYFV